MNAAPRDPGGSARRHPPLVWPLLALVGLTVLLTWWDVDLGLARGLFDEATGDWYYEYDPRLDLVDDVGPIAGVALGVGSLVVFVVGFWSPWLRRHQVPAMFLALAVLIGPFLIVNAALKGTWGRPRPNTLAEFGRDAEHLPPWSPGDQPEIHKSFPSGHASIGFYLIAPAFLFYRRRPGLFAALFAGGLVYGTLMSFSRVLQGSHFVTDVLWAAGIVYLTCAALHRVVDPEAAVENGAATEPAIGPATGIDRAAA